MTFFIKKRHTAQRILSFFMRRLLQKIALSVLANALAIFSLLEMFPDRIAIASSPEWLGVVLVGFVLGILNTFLKPLLKLISFPFMIITLGLFLVLINSFLLWITMWLFADILSSFKVALLIEPGISNFLLLAGVLALVNGILHWLFKR